MASSEQHRSVAIIGMSCLFPGAADLDAYWRNILGKVDAVTDPPAEAWDLDVYYDPEFSDTDKTYVKRGGYLGSLASFDPLAYGVPPVAVGGEPDQWLALKLAHDALADAGCTDLPAEIRERTGIVLGKGTYLNGGNAIAVQRGLVVSQTLALLKQLRPELDDGDLELLRNEMKDALPPIGPETVPGLVPNVIVGRIANRLDLMGPSYTVDAACASSLVAIQLAMRDLLDGTSDLVLAGGSQVWMPVPTLNVFCQLGALSRTERIRPFDKDADGTLLGEGIGMVVLKRAEDALRDGDRVYAVIRGVGVASDGRGMSVMAPRVDGQELALRKAYTDADVSPATIGLIEAHGTGTPVGDVVELESLTRVFGVRDGGLPSCAIGTVKSMISHTIPAAGVAGVIKLALSLYHRVLPPTLNCEQPNPKLELEKTPFYVNTETRPWIHGGSEPRRAGINAFGFGGINAHAVLEEVSTEPRLDHLPPWDTEVFVLRGESPAAVAETARRLARRVEQSAESYGLADLAHTLNRGAPAADQAVCLAIVAGSFDDLRAKLERAAARLEEPDCFRIKDMSGVYYEAEPLGRAGKVVFVFPGEGAQYAGMLGDLCLHFPEVREAFDRTDRLYRDHPRGYVTSDSVFPRPAFSEEARRAEEARLMQMDVAVESVFTANEAVDLILRRLEIRPDAAVGHSTGEYSAARSAGVLSARDEESFVAVCRALHRCYEAAESRDDLPRAVLLAVGADRERVDAVAREAGGDIFVAMDNCLHQAVLVGEPAAAQRARAILDRDGLIYSELPYDRAVHTPLFAAYAGELREVFADVEVGPATTALYSCTTAARYPDEPHAVRELFVEHWTRPVEFRHTIEQLYDGGARIFVEVGPRGNMTAFIDDILRGRRYCAVPANQQRRSGTSQLNHLVGILAAQGVGLDPAYLYAHRQVRHVDWERDAGGEAGKERAPKVDLAMRWPMLRLRDDVAEQLATAEPAANGNGNGNGHGALPLSEAPPPPANGVVSLTPPAPQPVVAGFAPAEDPGDLSLFLDAHVATMERFLTAQARIMQSFLAEPATAPAAPLVGTIVSSSAGVLVARRVFDPEEDVYLRDHALGRVVSSSDPSLPALMVMPLAMSLEILAEAAVALVPGLCVTGLRDVRAARWLAWEDEPRTLELTARRLADDGGEARVHVTLTEADARAETPAVEGVVVLRDAYPDAPPARHGAPTTDRASRWLRDELYADEMFHGPCWQGVRAIERTGASGVEARLEVLPWSRLFRSDPQPRFALDPIVLDAAGQVIGFWTAEHLERGKVIFPCQLAELEVYGPPRPVGEQVGCTAAIELVGEQLVRSDIDVADGEGRLWLRLTAWEDRRFDVPAQFRPLGRAGGWTPISTEWAVAAEQLSARDGLRCRRLETHLPDRGFWKRVWAHRVLSRSERVQYRGLRLPEARVLEWLGARTAAKEAVLQLVAQSHGLDLLPADVEIHQDGYGRPVVSGSWTSALSAAPVVSLAHTQGTAVALAAPGGRVGIDVEYLRGRPDGFARVAFAPAEHELLERLPGDAREEWTLRCWCAKEAVAKALGTGFTNGPQELAIVAVDPASGQIGVRIGRDAGSTVLAHTHRDGDLVVATTIFEPGGPDAAA